MVIFHFLIINNFLNIFRESFNYAAIAQLTAYFYRTKTLNQALFISKKRQNLIS